MSILNSRRHCRRNGFMQDNFQEKAKSVAKLSISPEVAQELVKAGTPTRHKSVQTFRRNIDSPQDSEDIRLALLQSAWSQNAAGIFTAQACFIVNDVPDTSFLFTVWAPVSTENPGGTSGATRFYVVWKGRWERLDKTGVANITVKKKPTSISLSTTRKTVSIISGRTSANVIATAEFSKNRPSITYISNVAVINGELVFTSATQYLVEDCSLTTTTTPAVTGFTIGNANVVENVSGTIAPTQVVTDVTV